MPDEFDPFRPPSSTVGDVTRAHAQEPAGRGRRLGTFVVDYLALLMVGGLLGLVAVLTMGEEGVAFIDELPDFLFGGLVLFAYYLFFEGLWSRTPGKWLFGTVVVDESGLKPTLGQILGRTACRLVPFEAFSFLGTSGWHDRIPRTRVVRHPGRL